MRKQIRSTSAVAQPNLLHMWSTRNQTGASADGSNDTQIAEETPLEAENTISIVAESAGVDYSLGAKCESTRTQVHGDRPQSIDLEASNMDETQPSKDPSDSADALKLVETAGQYSDGPQSLRQKASVTTERKGRQWPLNEGSQMNLYPIFGNRSKRKDDISAAESEPSSDKEVRELKTRKTRKAVTKSNGANFLKRTASEHTNAPLSIQDDVFVGLSSQPLPRPSDIIELTADNEELGPSFRPIAKGSQEEPIVIDSSPVRDVEEQCMDNSPLRKLQRPVRRGVFSATSTVGSPATTSRPRRKVGEGQLPNLPSKDNQHVRGAQRAFNGSPCDFLRPRTEPRRDDPSTSLADSISHIRVGEISSPKDEPRYLVEPSRVQQVGHAEFQDVRHLNASYPAISRFLKANNDTSSTWNDKWRPRCAVEAIGNAEAAMYLRDWLVALEIRPEEPHIAESSKVTTRAHDKSSQGVKRPQIIRAVDKPRKRRKRVDWDEESLDDWITSDEEEESPTLAFDEDSDDEHSDGRGSPWRPKLTRLSRRRPPDDDRPDEAAKEPTSAPTPAHDFSDRLTNAILLVGPTGSGKTATVYACAEELGWEVFEVYPGIGRRNGTSLVSLVGDVGKNHIVNRSSRGLFGSHEKHAAGSNKSMEASPGSKQDKRHPASKAFAPFFIKDRKDLSREASCGVSKSDYKEDVDFNSHESSTKTCIIHTSLDSASAHGRLPTPFENSDSRQISAQQSIILLEEVDILFAEDVNFWPTVVALIKESRRPVIMTCNDASLVPSEVLPLQTILSFDPCPPDLAVTYLRCMTLTEGHAVPEPHVKSLYGRNSHLDVLDIHSDLVRPSACPTSPPDLRQAINSLQFLCQGTTGLNNSNSPSSPNTIPNRDSRDDSALNDLSNWNWVQYPTSDSSFPFTPTEQAEIEKESALRIRDIWRASDSLSMINSYLARSPLAVLETRSYATGPQSDLELGYPCLECQTDIPHLQGGITEYNCDDAIALEAIRCVGIGSSAAHDGPGKILDNRAEERWKATSTTTEELLLKRAEYFGRVSGILEKIVPFANRQRVDSLVLDYEPWVRMIDRSDMDTEAAVLRESDTRRGARGGRSTRNSQRIEYQRYFDLDEGIRTEWHANGLAARVVETGSGEAECECEC